MTQRTLLEQYAEELMKASERVSHKKEGKKPHGACAFFAKEWSRQEIELEKVKVDGLIDEFKGVARLNGDASPEHMANIIFRNHWKASTHDDVWGYMVDTVGRAQEMNADEDEMWRTYYENRLRTCGPGDCNVFVYYTPRGRKARKVYAERVEVEIFHDLGDTLYDREHVYTCGGRRYYIVGGCYARVQAEKTPTGDSS